MFTGTSSPAERGSPMRNSPVVNSGNRTQSPVYRQSPKLEAELMELGNLPPSTPQYPSLGRYPHSRGSHYK